MKLQTRLEKRNEKMARTKRYPKLEGCRIRLARVMAIVRTVGMNERSVEDAALMFNKDDRCIRRDIDWVKKLTNSQTMKCVVHWMHSQGVAYTCEAERQDYLEREKKLREVA